jgi:hypothetical protein
MGWIVSGEERVLGNHDPLVSEELFLSVAESAQREGPPTQTAQ